MKISTEIGSTARFVGEERAVELCAKAGFDAWDFSIFRMAKFDWEADKVVPSDHPLTRPDYREFVKRLRKIGEDNGIHCNQSHAPFPSHCPEIRDYFKRTIECTALAGADICVIHPMNLASLSENREMYLELLPFAREYGVRIAVENMWEWDCARNHACRAACSHHDEFRAYMDTLEDEHFVACLDIGHAEMRGLETSAVKMIRALGNRLAALHIHDNDRWQDRHQLPFTMDIDFGPIVKALREVGYRGYFTLEADRCLSGYKHDVFAGLQAMAQAARRLADMFEER